MDVDSTTGPLALLTSLHTHSHYCDGKGEIADYARAALDAGLHVYGASGHAPLPFYCEYAMPLDRLGAYRDDVRRVADAFQGRLPVLLGLELDYLPGLSKFYEREILRRGFDYFVASVHYVGEPGASPWAYDESSAAFEREVLARHGGDARPVVEDYYRRVVAMVDEVSGWDVPVVVGHLDRVRLWNRDDRFFPAKDDWHLGLVDAALDAIAHRGLPIELNTSGLVKPAQSPNPDLPILRRARARDIPVLVSADAHLPGNVALRYPEAVGLLREAGYREMVVPDPAGWHMAPLPAT